jgi:co-chaperonin GroES (HSP10)
MEDLIPEALQSQLPQPVGYKLLCAIPEIDRTYKSGLIKADTTIHAEEITSVVLCVLRMGPEAYKDANKFPTGAWCKEGDFVICRSYSGTRIKIHGKPYVLINDDMVEGTIDDPRGVTRA